jgi:hypothetical protein
MPMIGECVRSGSWFAVVAISSFFVCGFRPYAREGTCQLSRSKIIRGITHEPAPAGALDGGGGGVELLLERIERAE